MLLQHGENVHLGWPYTCHLMTAQQPSKGGSLYATGPITIDKKPIVFDRDAVLLPLPRGVQLQSIEADETDSLAGGGQQEAEQDRSSRGRADEQRRNLPEFLKPRRDPKPAEENAPIGAQLKLTPQRPGLFDGQAGLDIEGRLGAHVGGSDPARRGFNDQGTFPANEAGWSDP